MPYKNLNAVEFKSAIERESDAIVLDVRTAEEVAAGCIAGAVNIDYYGRDFTERISAFDRGRPIFVYCRSGKRSRTACVMMDRVGFTRLYNLDGGFLSWS